MLKEKIESYISGIDATFGISIKHLQTNEEVHIQGDRYFQTASVVKVPILAALYDAVYKGKIDVSERIVLRREDRVPGSGVIQEMDTGISPTIKDLATMMIIVSDNMATDKLLSMVDAQSVQDYMRAIGLEHIFVKHSIWELLSLCAGIEPTAYSDEMFDQIINTLIAGHYNRDSIVFQGSTENNVSTTRDMNRLMEKIAKGEIFSEACSADIRDILLRQQYTQRIPGLLPRGTKVANKTGSLGTMYNDTGIVYLPDQRGEFVITVFSVGKTLDYEGNGPIARISKIAFDHFLEGAAT
ncbi:class A beta-lactamase-related serine hydrolase [Sporosarcina sp. ACRSL]|uniref:serine hydrolase n=1 Tax=Sporosarcina sp. ACRSL TaxID=2918215 RepID=UPI001EF5EB52|nr:serine hydrolase [Sporosarcina sp. ACRSL]MCG7344368.1 class A beta-lactamase-related serine hydrolase [Sporosarcina sp. ACRSL]